MRPPILLASLLFAAAAVAAAPTPPAATAATPHLPYNAAADAKADVARALAEAKAARVPVLLIFGANWCEDCRALDKALKEGKNAQLMQTEFKVVKVDVGNFDHNLDVAQTYGNPLKKGIPAAVLVSSDNNQVLYATKGGELANARRMSESGIYDFFKQAASVKSPAI
ncbi:thioredoxin family protein [Janthinobacterium sp. BJB1]|uniref:thioredoxin family protein n=1 Tax=Janthinobacterium sp. GW458P TaxID=1981504 RepID=UPI000A327008|nr:thioredoxin family protein [Janthinobacterium sp. GW458P]MBE3028420.1 thioredoxin family protein [Janthinobacterium sp. GW458P]PHV13677.1 thioredoxin family protein [Janthinobacterium sp. BJB303]PJC95610.1 thioredoxin family protein [Janthinobacterium sp. BJB1]